MSGDRRGGLAFPVVTGELSQVQARQIVDVDDQDVVDPWRQGRDRTDGAELFGLDQRLQRGKLRFGQWPAVRVDPRGESAFLRADGDVELLEPEPQQCPEIALD